MPKLPISFAEFKASPMKAIMYLLILGVCILFSYLMLAQKAQISTVKQQLKECKTETYVLGVEMRQMREHNIIRDSIANSLKATIKVLKDLGKLPPEINNAP